MQRVRLIRKFAEALNGLDLSAAKVGDLLDLPETLASMLIREGWAEAVVQ